MDHASEEENNSRNQDINIDEHSESEELFVEICFVVPVSTSHMYGCSCDFYDVGQT